MQLIPVILSGGAGSRLWPVSRELRPKPFIRLADGECLLQKSFLRIAALPGVEEVLTVTNRDLYFQTEDEYRAVNHAGMPTSFILEPVGRNTAPAVAVAAIHVAATHGEDTILLVQTADHLVSKQEAFASAVAHAADLAREGWVVTFGVQPESPETGYGYIEVDHSAALPATPDAEVSAYLVTRFAEKPSPENAQEYLDSGNYLWNSGMFCFRAGTVIEDLAEHAPDILAGAQACLASSRQTKGADGQFSHVELDVATFMNVPDISLDYALIEKSRRVAVVSCDIGWSDIGSWAAIGDLVDPDAQGNRVEGEALLHDVTDCYIQGGERLVSAVGVTGLIIIDTPDALLVADCSRTQDVKHIVTQLKESGHQAYRLHREVHRPWGTYTVLEDSNRFKIKRIIVKSGASLSLQMHHHRSEHWIVVSGMAKVVNGDQELFINTNESTYIPSGHTHRLANPGVMDLVLIEVQSGDYLGEDDIVRFEDTYGRA